MKDRVVIITGAGRGLGKTFAEHFARAGAIPVIAERDAANATKVAEAIIAEGGRALAVPTDICDADSVAAMVETTVSELGRVDVLINNAAMFASLDLKPFDTIPLDEWDAVLRTNITGAFLCARSVVGVMREAGWGRIINMSSDTAAMGMPFYLHYTTSKAALMGMARSMARELGPHGITVNAVLPGATVTEVPRPPEIAERRLNAVKLQCIPRPETAEDLVGTILFLASDASAFITGQSIIVNGGACHS